MSFTGLYVSDKAKQNPGALSLIPQKQLGLQSLQISSACKFNIIFTLNCGDTLLMTNSIKVSLISSAPISQLFTHLVEYI